MGILNRSNPFIAHAPFQQCTEGLRPLFADSTPAECTSNLALSLLRSPTSPIERRHIALHILPTVARPLDSWLPQSPSYPSSSTQTTRTTASPASVYRSGGVGHIYGTNVSSVEDEAEAARSKLREAQYARERAENYVNYDDRKSYRKGTASANERKWQGRTYTAGGWDKHAAGRVFREKKVLVKKAGDVSGWMERRADERSKAFAIGGQRVGVQVEGVEETGQVEGEEAWMLVRMVPENWESATWATANVTVDSAPAISNSQKSKGTNLVADILGATRTYSQSITPSSAIPTSYDSSHLSPKSELPGPPPLPRGPARILASSQTPPPSTTPQHTKSRNPFGPKATLSQQSSYTSTQRSSQESMNDPLSFASTGKKRSFGGPDVVEGKRKVMKLFGGGTKR
jgi:hypothetical protein